MNSTLDYKKSDSQSELQDFSIHFIGKELFYSNQTIRSVKSEFGVSAFRHESIATVKTVASDQREGGKVIVIDQLLLNDLLSNPERYADIAGAGCLAFAFRKENPARHLFAHWNRRKYGDMGYLPMNVAPDVWRSVLRLLMHEELYLPCFLADHMAEAEDTSAATALDARKPLFASLTRREKQVLQLVSQGDSNKVIASKLGITEHTVKLHMHNVSGKLGVSNRTAAAQVYFEVAPEVPHGKLQD